MNRQDEARDWLEPWGRHPGDVSVRVSQQPIELTSTAGYTAQPGLNWSPGWRPHAGARLLLAQLEQPIMRAPAHATQECTGSTGRQDGDPTLATRALARTCNPRFLLRVFELASSGTQMPIHAHPSHRGISPGGCLDGARAGNFSIARAADWAGWRSPRSFRAIGSRLQCRRRPARERSCSGPGPSASSSSSWRAGRAMSTCSIQTRTRASGMVSHGIRGEGGAVPGWPRLHVCQPVEVPARSDNPGRCSARSSTRWRGRGRYRVCAQHGRQDGRAQSGDAVAIHRLQHAGFSRHGMLGQLRARQRERKPAGVRGPSRSAGFPSNGAKNWDCGVPPRTASGHACACRRRTTRSTICSRRTADFITPAKRCRLARRHGAAEPRARRTPPGRPTGSMPASAAMNSPPACNSPRPRRSISPRSPSTCSKCTASTRAGRPGRQGNQRRRGDRT